MGLAAAAAEATGATVRTIAATQAVDRILMESLSQPIGSRAQINLFLTRREADGSAPPADPIARA